MKAGHAHAVVAIVHEVVPTQPQQAHRRQLDPESKSSIDPLPLLRRGPRQGHEVNVELLVLAYATDYPRNLDRPHSPIHSSTGRNAPPDLVGREEGASSIPPEQVRLQPAQPRPPPGDGKVLLNLVIQVHQIDHAITFLSCRAKTKQIESLAHIIYPGKDLNKG